MGQYFRIVNHSTKQYVEPFSMFCSERFPSLIMNPMMCRLITWLVCGSNSSYYRDLKSQGFYTSKYLGTWYGKEVDAVGDYEEDLYQTITKEYENITIEAIAMLLERDNYLIDQMFKDAKEDMFAYRCLAEIVLLNPGLPQLLPLMTLEFGKQWKEKYYKVKYT